MIQPSFLHRLQDNFPQEEENDVAIIYQYQHVVQTLMTDLNMLFSSRAVFDPAMLFDELPKSILNYGVSDIINVDISNDKRVEVLNNNIYQTLFYFEPRLQDLAITLKKNSAESIEFRVSALFLDEKILFSISWSSTAYTYSLSWER